MSAAPSLSHRFGLFGWAALLAFLTAIPVRAQDLAAGFDPSSQPLLLRDINLWATLADTPPPPLSSTPRLRLPRMPVTSLGDPLGLIDDDDLPADPNAPAATSESDGSRVQVSMGQDNPFFDFRRRGSPGGVGYYKVQTQYQFLTTGTTGCTFTFQAVRPAGLESNGVNEGPSFMSPALTIFHDLGGGSALHAFIGKDVRANSTWREGVSERGNLMYGVAVQQPLAIAATDPSRGLFFFMEAQGCCSDRDQGLMNAWELVPGLHYRLNDSWWLSGGVLLPVGPTRYGSTGHWHLSCSWQF
jgi:hypothetical protein